MKLICNAVFLCACASPQRSQQSSEKQVETNESSVQASTGTRLLFRRQAGLAKRWPYHPVHGVEVWRIPVGQKPWATEFDTNDPQGVLDAYKAWHKQRLSGTDVDHTLQATRAFGTDDFGLATCFTPRHLVVFFDENKSVVGLNLLCFECEAAKLFPQWRGVKSRDESQLIGALFALRGIAYKNGIKVEY